MKFCETGFDSDEIEARYPSRDEYLSLFRSVSYRVLAHKGHLERNSTNEHVDQECNEHPSELAPLLQSGTRHSEPKVEHEKIKYSLRIPVSLRRLQDDMKLPLDFSVLNDHEYYHTLQPKSDLNTNDIFLNILTFIPLNTRQLRSLSSVCRAWRERIVRAPQWGKLLCVSLFDRINLGWRDQMYVTHLMEACATVAATRQRDSLRDQFSKDRQNTDTSSLYVSINGITTSDQHESISLQMTKKERRRRMADVAGSESLSKYFDQYDFITLCAFEKEYAKFKVLPSRAQRLKAGMLFLGLLFILFTVLFLASFFAGYNQNSLESDYTFAAFYWVAFLPVLVVIYVISFCCCLLDDNTRNLMYFRGVISFLGWSMVGFVLCFIAGLIGLRLATIRYLEGFPIYEADRCPSFSNESEIGNLATPQLVTFSDGLRDWNWTSSEPLQIDLSLGGNVTIPYFIFLLSWSMSVCAGSRSSLIPRQVAFLVPNNLQTSSSSDPFTIKNLPLNPLTTFSTTSLDLRVPMHLKYDDPFSYPDSLLSLYVNWYTASPLWLTHRVPLLPLVGEGTITSTDPNVFPTAATLKHGYLVGVLALAGGCGFMLLATVVGICCPLTCVRRYLYMCSTAATLLIINPIHMSIWGAICLSHHRACLMPPSGPYVLFALSGIMIVLLVAFGIYRYRIS